MPRDLIVVGAGPSGLMAAIHAADAGLDVLVLEQQPLLGARLCMSAMGHGAVSNARISHGQSHTHFRGRHARFVSDALAALPLTALVEWFHHRGVAITEAPFYGLMVAPEGGAAVVEALLDALEQSGAELRTEARAVSAAVTDAGFDVTLGSGETLSCRKLLLATGAGNMPQLGTALHGFALAGMLGHAPLPTLPALVPITVSEPWAMRACGCWMDVRAALLADGRKVAETEGSVLFTYSGLTGEAMFNLSSEIAPRMLKGEALTLELNLYPDLTRDDVAEWMHRVLGERTRENAIRALDHMLPAALAAPMLKALKVKPHKRSMHLERADRETLLEWFTGARLPVTGVLDARAAEGMSGGVPVREINPRTFESRVTPGLHIVGGMLDINADWGGFNRHFSFASGFAAAQALR